MRRIIRYAVCKCKERSVVVRRTLFKVPIRSFRHLDLEIGIRVQRGEWRDSVRVDITPFTVIMLRLAINDILAVHSAYSP
jgi:hypothetical protein